MVLSALSGLTACYTPYDKVFLAGELKVEPSFVDEKAKDLQGRFKPPAGFTRKQLDSNSFAYYLRHLTLKPANARVKLYNGATKLKQVHAAVIDMPLADKNLQQCADAIMRLRAEYFFSAKEYDKISFTLTNGFKVDYSKWIQGYRVVVNQNNTSWTKSTGPSNTYNDLENYLEFIFTYAGPLSLAKSLRSKKLKSLAIGDVFIVGGSPGHAVIVVDLAENESGEKVFMLAQSYMPAQETHVLKNLQDKANSPWYQNNFLGNLHTPEWTFTSEQLKTW